MVQHTVAFYCVLYDGDIVLKDYGNASGSGTTTRDNTLCHKAIAAGFLSEAYYIKNGELPSFELLSQQVVMLFGDDSIFGVDKEFDYVLDGAGTGDGFLHKYFQRLGMGIKFLHGGEDFPLSGISFLGFHFKEKDGYFFPLYDPIRIATSFIHVNDKKDTLDAYCSKIFVLTMMSYASDKFDLFYQAYLNVVSNVSKLHSQNPIVQSFLDARLTPAVLHGFYTGSESNSSGFYFFESLLEVGGHNLTQFDNGFEQSFSWGEDILPTNC
jgi:hypothetical protein